MICTCDRPMPQEDGTCLKCGRPTQRRLVFPDGAADPVDDDADC